MTFLNALLGFGAAAFVVPLIIHLLHRSKFQILDWGAMHLLESSIKVNSRKIQWQHLLLLLLRCLLPVLLAFAMARPLIQSWKSSGTDSAVALSVILDDSMSMFARDGGANQTRFASACATLSELLSQLPSGSSASIILGGDAPERIADQVPETLVKRLQETRDRTIPAGPMDLDSATRSALEWLGAASQTRRHLIVMSDFQKSDWSGDANQRHAEVKALIEQQTVRPSLNWFQVGNSTSAATARVNRAKHNA